MGFTGDKFIMLLRQETVAYKAHAWTYERFGAFSWTWTGLTTSAGYRPWDKGGGGGGWGGTGPKNNFFRPFGPQFGLKIRGGLPWIRHSQLQRNGSWHRQRITKENHVKDVANNWACAWRKTADLLHWRRSWLLILLNCIEMHLAVKGVQ